MFLIIFEMNEALKILQITRQKIETSIIRPEKDRALQKKIH